MSDWVARKDAGPGSFRYHRDIMTNSSSRYSSRRVAVIDALRTPIGRFAGGLAAVRPDDMAAEVMRSLVARTGMDPALVDEVFFGAANQAGEDNRNVARMATLLAELPHDVAAVTFSGYRISVLPKVTVKAVEAFS